MNKYQEFDLDHWARRKHFEFYQAFESPHYCLNAKLPAQVLHDFCKKRGDSFFLMALYGIARAVNQIPEMHQRLVNGRIREYKHLDTLTPIGHSQDLFTQLRCPYAASFEEYQAGFEAEKARVLALPPSPTAEGGDDFFCASCNPWFAYESATIGDYRFDQESFILRWGKYCDGKILVTSKANHCYLDGVHMSRFYNALQRLWENPEMLL